MGVHGLTTFVNRNPQLFKKFELYNSRVVIDGNGLCHKLYRDLCLDPYLGGDYDIFRLKLLRYFGVFAKCRIKVVVVFDGAYDVEDRKLKTTLARAQQRLTIAKKANRGVYIGNNMLPILAIDVLRDVIIELSIEYYQSDFEADDFIAALANQLKCPVLSQDSDFFIFPLTHGYIQLDDLGSNPKIVTNMTGNKVIIVQLYKTENLLNKFKDLDPKALCLLAVMLGNDFVNRFDFDSFYSNIRLPKKHCQQLHGNGSTTANKIIGLLQWMQHMTIDEVIQKIVAFAKDAKKLKLEKSIKEGIDNYVIDESIVTRTSPELLQLPCWFQQQFRAALIPAMVLNVALKSRVFLLPQIEDWTLSSSYVCSGHLRQVIYGIVLDRDDVMVTEFCRVENNYIRQSVQPTLTLSGSKVPTLEGLELLSKCEKAAIVSTILKTEDTSSLPEDFIIFFSVINCWLKSSDIEVTSTYVTSLLVGVLTTYFVNCFKKLETDRGAFMAQNGSEWVLSAWEDKAQRKACTLRWRKLNAEMKLSNAVQIDLLPIHYMAQLQTTLLFTSFLNRLMGLPFCHCNVAMFINGKVIYNAFQLEQKKQLVVTSEEPHFQTAYDTVYHWLMRKNGCADYVINDFIDVEHSTKAQPKKKRKRSKKLNPAQNNPIQSHEVKVSEEDINVAEKFEIYCEITNKYESLQMPS
ncbi:hypothetical protein CHUAL_011477 [Chamberlinius hualienensis]